MDNFFSLATKIGVTKLLGVTVLRKSAGQRVAKNQEQETRLAKVAEMEHFRSQTRFFAQNVQKRQFGYGELTRQMQNVSLAASSWRTKRKDDGLATTHRLAPRDRAQPAHTRQRVRRPHARQRVRRRRNRRATGPSRRPPFMAPSRTPRRYMLFVTASLTASGSTSPKPSLKLLGTTTVPPVSRTLS